MNFIKRNILWIDSLGALSVGALILLMNGWLSEWYQLPQILLIFIGVVNLSCGLYSLLLAIRRKCEKIRILSLVGINFVWALICLFLFVEFNRLASIYGLAHLLMEGVYVGGLAFLEYKGSADCVTTQQSSAALGHRAQTTGPSNILKIKKKR